MRKKERERNIGREGERDRKEEKEIQCYTSAKFNDFFKLIGSRLSSNIHLIHLF